MSTTYPPRFRLSRWSHWGLVAGISLSAMSCRSGAESHPPSQSSAGSAGPGGGVGVAGWRGDSAGGDKRGGSAGSAGTPGSDADAEVPLEGADGASGDRSAPSSVLDLRSLDPSVISEHQPDPEGLQKGRDDAAAILKQLSIEQKLTIVQGCDGKYVGNTPPAGPLPALTLQDGPAGVRGFDDVTAFPAPITLAASWDRDLVRRWGEAMGAEQRAKGVMIQLGPMINLSRVPTGGRNFEGFGEDPYLSAELVVQTIVGIQSQKVLATAKHYVGNEQETDRMSANSEIDERTLHEVYYEPFAASVRAGVGAVMCSYNRINGAFACDDPVSLGYLKEGMGFSGFVMSDWGATHGVGAAQAGLDMEMPSGAWFGGLSSAIQAGTVSASRLDDMVTRILTSLLRVGVLRDPPTESSISEAVLSEHAALAREAATAGITLLKNERSALPLHDGVKSIAVIGSAAYDDPLAVGGGSAEVVPKYVVPPLTSICHRDSAIQTVTYAQGDRGASVDEAVAIAKNAEAAVVFAAVHSTEGEDRASLSLPAEMDALIRAVAAVNARTIVVLHAPGAVLMPWIDEVSAVLAGFYPGQENGAAVASVICGDVNPAGRLPVSFPRSEADLPKPSISNVVAYTEKLGIGYRGLEARGVAPLFPFGHGLSYTTFEYADLALYTGSAPGSVQVVFSVTNTGAREGIETPQLYLSFPPSAGEPPIVLRGFERVTLAPGASRRVAIEVGPRAFSAWDPSAHARYVPSGTYRIAVGRSSRDLPLTASLDVLGVAEVPR